MTFALNCEVKLKSPVIIEHNLSTEEHYLKQDGKYINTKVNKNTQTNVFLRKISTIRKSRLIVQAYEKYCTIANLSNIHKSSLQIVQ